MPSARQRASANAPDTSTVSLNEKILKECHDLYTEKEKGSFKKLLSLFNRVTWNLELSQFLVFIFLDR